MASLQENTEKSKLSLKGQQFIFKSYLSLQHQGNIIKKNPKK